MNYITICQTDCSFRGIVVLNYVDSSIWTEVNEGNIWGDGSRWIKGTGGTKGTKWKKKNSSYVFRFAK